MICFTVLFNINKTLACLRFACFINIHIITRTVCGRFGNTVLMGTVSLILKGDHAHHCTRSYDKIHSGAPAARRAAKRSPIVIAGKKRKPMKDFLMVIMASGIARGRVRTTTTTESRNMAAILQKIG